MAELTDEEIDQYIEEGQLFLARHDARLATYEMALEIKMWRKVRERLPDAAVAALSEKYDITPKGTVVAWVQHEDGIGGRAVKKEGSHG